MGLHLWNIYVFMPAPAGTSGPAERQAGSLALYKVRLWLKMYLLYTHVVTQVIHISPAPSTITPTSLECQDCALAHRIPRPLCFTGLQVSVMCGSALPPADHERMNRPADLRMAPPGASLQRFLRRAPPPHRAGANPSNTGERVLFFCLSFV